MDIVAVELRAFVGNAVDVRGGDIAAMKADVGPAEVIGEQDDDVRFSRLGDLRRRSRIATRQQGSAYGEMTFFMVATS